MRALLPRHRWQAIALAGAALSLLAAFVRGRATPDREGLSYLFVFLFFTGLAVGSLALLMVHELTGGAWGERLRPPLAAAARTLPLQALLALPLLGAVHQVYPWARSGVMAGDALLQRQSWYLNAGFFDLRTIVYFALWLFWLRAMSPEQAREPGAARRSGAAATGLIVFAISTLLAATDWVVSLLPHWHSTVFGMLLATGWMLSAAALAVLSVSIAPSRTDVREDLGNLLLMFVLAWGYLAYMQYLTVWIADLPDENAWYIPRTLTSWRFLAGGLFVAQLLVPFAVLLSRTAKRRQRWLAAIAALLLLSSLVNALWLTVPSVVAAGFSVTLVDALMLLGVGGLWLALYIGELGGADRRELRRAHG